MHDEVVDLQYCPSAEQVADIFTEVFSERTFNNINSLIGISDHVVNIY